MFPTAGQQGGAGYHHLGYHHPQYTPDLTCNFQSFVGETWHPHHPAHPHPNMWAAHPHTHPCQQRSPGYEDWITPLHHTSGPSPVPLQSQPHPHTPSPCLPPAPTSPNFYPKPQEYGEVSAPSPGHMLGDGAGQGASSPPAPPGQGVTRPQQARSPYEWMKKPAYQAQLPDGAYMEGEALAMKGTLEEEAERGTWRAGKTRTKDKYRVVYSDHQRLELEKEFHYSRYITIRRKSELAAMLGLSERQVKIWFQNRRAKERKQMKKRDELLQKEKLESTQQYHTPSHPHHTLPHTPPTHIHPHAAHASLHPHLGPPPTQHHHQGGKPLMMDVKPVLGIE